MRVFIVTNINKPKVRPAMDELIPWVESRAQLVGVDTDATVDLAAIDTDAFLVFGGDGTLLATARRLRGKQVPVMGVNFGRLGFLASFTPDEFKDQLEALIEKKLPITSRLMIESSIIDASSDCKLTVPDEVVAKRRW